MTKGVPAHLMPIDIEKERDLLLKKHRLLDWGLPMNKPSHIPTNEEICNSFSDQERLKIVFTSSFMLMLLRDFILYDVLLYCKYPSTSKHKPSCRQLNDYANEIDKTHHQANTFEICKMMDSAFDRVIKENGNDMSKLKLATSQELLMKGKTNHSLSIAINNALLMIDGVKRHGDYVGQQVAKKAGVKPQEFELSKIMKKIRAALINMAKAEDCCISPSTNMRLGLDILVKKFIEKLEDEKKDIEKSC